MARKIIDYRLEFIPEIGLGSIQFHEEGNATPISLPNLRADVFCAMAEILSHPNAYAEKGRIMTIDKGGSMRSQNTDGY